MQFSHPKLVKLISNMELTSVINKCLLLLQSFYHTTHEMQKIGNQSREYFSVNCLINVLSFGSKTFKTRHQLVISAYKNPHRTR